MTELSDGLPSSSLPPVVAPPRRPRVWTVFVTYGVTMLSVILVSAVIPTVIAFKEHGPAIKPADIAAAALTFVGLMGSLVCTMILFVCAAILGGALSSQRWRERLRLRGGAVRLPSLLAGSLGVLAIGLVFKSLDGLSWIPHSPLLEMLDQFLKGLHGPALVAAVLVVGILPGVAEELFFRGYIQTRLAARWGAGWGIVWTSLMFGVMHLDLVQGTFAMLVGVFLGYLAEQTGSIVPSMICHAANNTIATLLSVANADFTGRRANGVALIAGLIIIVTAWLALRSLRPPASRAQQTC